jgi:hypothetical protein
MEMGIYSLFDKKAGAYKPPMYAVNDSVMIRSVRQALSDGNQTFCDFPEDYCLVRFGTFSDHNGQFDVAPTAEVIVEIAALTAEMASVGGINESPLESAIRVAKNGVENGA